MRQLSIAAALLLCLSLGGLAGRVTAQPTPRATLRSLDSFEPVPVFTDYERVKDFYTSGAAHSPGQVRLDSRSTLSRQSWHITLRGDGTPVTELDRVTFTVYNPYYRDFGWGITLVHVMLDDGHEGWVESTYVF